MSTQRVSPNNNSYLLQRHVISKKCKNHKTETKEKTWKKKFQSSISYAVQ